MRWLQIDGMWPYWLDGAGPSTVHNSIVLDSMVLLTGDGCSSYLAWSHAPCEKECQVSCMQC